MQNNPLAAQQLPLLSKKQTDKFCIFYHYLVVTVLLMNKNRINFKNFALFSLFSTLLQQLKKTPKKDVFLDSIFLKFFHKSIITAYHSTGNTTGHNSKAPQNRPKRPLSGFFTGGGIFSFQRHNLSLSCVVYCLTEDTGSFLRSVESHRVFSRNKV